MTTSARWLIVLVAASFLIPFAQALSSPILPLTLLILMALWALTSVDTSGDIECWGPPPWDPDGKWCHYTIRDGREFRTAANLRDDKKYDREAAKRNAADKQDSQA